MKHGTPTPADASATSADILEQQVPSSRFLELAEMSADDLEKTFLRGTTPELDSLAGWEFRGLNRPGWARALGIKKFIKGFFREDAVVRGYNCPVRQNAVQGPWRARPRHDAPRRFGYYLVTPVDATSRENAHLHAVLLDYGRGGNSAFDPTRGLRDYLVQVDPDNPDLFLGKAYYALAGRRIQTNFFLLERLRQGLGPISSR